MNFSTTAKVTLAVLLLSPAVGSAATVTQPSITLTQSTATVFLSSNAAAPTDEERDTDANVATASRADLGGFASGDIAAGELKLSTSTNGLRNNSFAPLNIDGLADVQLEYVFKNTGSGSFFIQPGDLRYSIDATFLRAYIDPDFVGIGTQSFSTGLLGTLSLAGASSGNGSVNVLAAGNASEVTIDAKPNITPPVPDTSLFNVITTVSQADGDGVVAVLQNKDAIEIQEDKILRVTAFLRGTALMQFGPNSTCAGTGSPFCAIADANLDDVGASVFSLNTGRLGLTVPEGTVINGFSTTPTWITTAGADPSVVPLPAGPVLLLTAIGGLGLLRARKMRR